MDSIIRYGGWLVALVIAIGSGVVLYNAQQSQRALAERANAAELAVAEAESRVELLAEEVRQQAESGAAIQAALEELKAQQPAESPAESIEAAPPMEVAEAAGEPDIPDPASDGPSQQERVVNAQLGMVADMTYQELYNELGLNPEQRGLMRAAITDYMGELQKLTQGAFRSKDQKARDVYARMEALKADLRGRVGEQLTAEGMVAWDGYEPVADQIMYERVVDGQLNMLASGLSNENRVLASQVVAEELVRAFDVYNQSDELYTLTNFNNAQAIALNTSLERLSGSLEADQLGLVEGFVNQALTMFEALKENDP